MLEAKVLIVTKKVTKEAPDKADETTDQTEQDINAGDRPRYFEVLPILGDHGLNKGFLAVRVLAGFVNRDIVSSVVGRAVNAIINEAELAQVNKL